MSHEFKIILLGESGVGKTSLIHTYISGQFSSNRKSTKVVNLKSKELTLKGKRVKLCIWDTSSQEFFKNVVPNYYDGLLLVYDVTDMTTFNALSDWLRLLRRKNEGAATLIVGNKTDLLDSTCVSRDVAMKFAKEEHLEFMESSAKNSDNVTQIFEHLTLKILEVMNLVPNEVISSRTSMSSSFSYVENFSEHTSHEISSTVSFSDQSVTPSLNTYPEQNADRELDSAELRVQTSFNNANNHETTLKNLPQTLPNKKNVHPSMSRFDHVRGDDNTNNHETILKNPQQISLRKNLNIPESDLFSSHNNTNNHETILKNSEPTSLKENEHLNNSDSDHVSGNDNTNNHETTLKSPQQTSLCGENSHSNVSESAHLVNGNIDDDDMEEIENSFVFVSFLPPIVPLSPSVPLLRVGRRRTSADSVLSLMTEAEINNVKRRAT